MKRKDRNKMGQANTIPDGPETERSNGERSNGERSNGERSNGERSNGERSNGERSNGGSSDGGGMDRRLLALTGAVTVLPALAGILLWNRLPDRIATHFNIAGEADGWSGKPFAVVGLPLFLLAMHLLCAFVVSMDPRRRNVGRRVFSLVLWICPAVSLFAEGMILGNALPGVSVDNNRMGMFFTGLLFIIVGNYLPKCRQNYTVGIKLPWTMADEDNWNRTHRMAGPVWIAAGAVVLLCGLLGAASVWTILVPTLGAALIPVVYSAALYWRGRRENGQ